MTRRIYVASSWRNEHQPSVVLALRQLGHEVYDFRNPQEGNHGFSWDQVGLTKSNWNREAYLKALHHQRAIEGFKLDFSALEWCTDCLLLLPCGRSAHLEAGWAKGAKKRLWVYVSEQSFEPELMYIMADFISNDIQEIYKQLNYGDD